MLFSVLALLGGQTPLIGIYPTLVPEYYEAYADWVAQAGGRSVVLPRMLSERPLELELLFRGINGLLIPGGEAFVGNGSVDALVARAARANLAEGDYFPVWGTCLGFEYLVDILGGTGAEDPRGPDDPIVPGFDAESLPAALNLTDAAAGSRLLRGAGAPLLRAAGEENLTYNAHALGIEPAAFALNARLSGTFRLLASALDRRRRPFVAMIEGIGLPFYATQFHPEKVEFVSCRSRAETYSTSARPTSYASCVSSRSPLPLLTPTPRQVPSSPFQPNIPNSPHAKAFSRHLGAFFIAEARKSGHHAAEGGISDRGAAAPAVSR